MLFEVIPKLFATCRTFFPSLMPGGIGYVPGKPNGPGTGRGLVSLLITLRGYMNEVYKIGGEGV